MARVRFVAPTPSEVALVAAATKTILQLVCPANRVQVIKGYAFSFDGTSNVAEPIRVEVLKQTNAGTMSACPVYEETAFGIAGPGVTAQVDATVEPTAATPPALLRVHQVHPQGGGIFEKLNIEDEIQMGPGTRIGFRATTAAGVTCNVSGYAIVEE